LRRKRRQRGDHRNVHALEKDIRAWVANWNDNPKPFVWTKTAEQIPAIADRKKTSDVAH